MPDAIRRIYKSACMKNVFIFFGCLFFSNLLPAQTMYLPHVLLVGDNMPDIAIQKWMKGGPYNVREKGKVFLIDFWAAWCGPCKALGPIVDEVANEYIGKLKVMKLDVDRNSATPMRYGIRGIPALLLFKDGKVADQIVGYVPKDTIERSISRVIG